MKNGRLRGGREWEEEKREGESISREQWDCNFNNIQLVNKFVACFYSARLAAASSASPRSPLALLSTSSPAHDHYHEYERQHGCRVASAEQPVGVVQALNSHSSSGLPHLLL